LKSTVAQKHSMENPGSTYFMKFKLHDILSRVREFWAILFHLCLVYPWCLYFHLLHGHVIRLTAVVLQCLCPNYP
jgi:hypothetical protein